MEKKSEENYNQSSNKDGQPDPSPQPRMNMEDSSDEAIEKIKEIADAFNQEQSEEANAPASEAQKLPEEAREHHSLQLENKTLKDQLLRATAEMDNLRKRHAKELQEAKQYAIKKFAHDLTPVLDNLYRATESISSDFLDKYEEFKACYAGVLMTQKEMLSAFEKHGIKRISPKEGDKFDHNFHQAMSQVEDNEKPSSSIVTVIKPGYVINDRILSPALVITSKGSN